MSGAAGGRPAGETVVVGLGNPLMSDDGLGVAALERLREGWEFEPYVELLDGGTWGMSLLPFVERAARLLVLDAIRAQREPGELIELEGDEIPRFLSTKLSPHQVDLREVLALAELRGTLPERMAAIGLQPARVAMGTKLSDPLAGGVDRLVERAVERLRAWGHAARPRTRSGGNGDA